MNGKTFIKDYIEELKKRDLYVKGGEDIINTPVAVFTYDSRDVKEGTLFVVKGAAFKEEYLKESVQKGAFCYISEKEFDVQIPGIIVTDIRKAMAYAANIFYGYPQKDLKMVGITGTKGKTTTVYYLKAVFDDYLRSLGDKESGITSSVDYYDGITLEESHNTTPEAMELLKHIRNAADCDLGFFEMEVSSQALKYDRVLGLRYDVGVFLNVSEDHISPIEHSDMEDYFSSKLKLFELCETAVINADSDHFERIREAAAKSRKILTFGIGHDADVFGFNIRKTDKDITFSVRYKDTEEEYMITMPGLFNVENALAVIAVSLELGIPAEYIKSGLKRARVPGRMELYTSRDGIINAIVDYAHNRLSFKKLFESVKKEYPGIPVLAVFGSAGGKAFSRRKDLGEVSAEYMDMIFLTEEDPGEEDPLQTMEDIAKHIRPKGVEHYLIADRKEAIEAALSRHDEKTVYLILGKGAETTEKIGKAYVPYPSDVDIVTEYIEKYDRGDI